MVWAKLDDAILDNPKIASVGVFGFALHVAAITWCARNLSDGFIPSGRISALLPLGRVNFDRANPLALAEGDRSVAGEEGLDAEVIASALVETGLWHRVPGGYQLHDFLDYNPSREKVLSAKAADVARKKKRPIHGQLQPDFRSDSDTEATADDVRDSGRNPRSPGPDPIKRLSDCKGDLKTAARARETAPVTNPPTPGATPPERGPDSFGASFDLAALEDGIRAVNGSANLSSSYGETARWAQVLGKVVPKTATDRPVWLRDAGTKWAGWCAAKGVSPSLFKFNDWVNDGMRAEPPRPTSFTKPEPPPPQYAAPKRDLEREAAELVDAQERRKASR